MSESQAEGEAEVIGAMTRLFAALMRDQGGEDRVLRALPAAYPWLRFLPEDGQREFVEEFIETARACVDVGNLYRLEVASWRHTAEVYAQPDLLEALAPHKERDDYGPVPVPDVDR